MAHRQVGLRLFWWRLQRPHLFLAHLTFVYQLLLLDFLFVVEAPSIVQRAGPLLPYDRRRVLVAAGMSLDEIYDDKGCAMILLLLILLLIFQTIELEAIEPVFGLALRRLFEWDYYDLLIGLVILYWLRNESLSHH